MEARYGMSVIVKIAPLVEDDQGFHIEATKSRRAVDVAVAGATVDPDLEDEDAEYGEAEAEAETFDEDSEDGPQPESNESEMLDRATRRDGGRGDRDGSRRRRGRRGGRNRNRGREDGGEPNGNVVASDGEADIDDNIGNRASHEDGADNEGNS
jgi:ribonuclease E